jgi:hypothetical protein
MADRALSLVMEKRPVLYSRAPVWWGFGFLAGKPRVHDGDDIKINPYTTTGLNADFDGNCVIGSTKIVIRVDKNSDAYNKLKELSEISNCLGLQKPLRLFFVVGEVSARRNHRYEGRL